MLRCDDYITVVAASSIIRPGVLKWQRHCDLKCYVGSRFDGQAWEYYPLLPAPFTEHGDRWIKCERQPFQRNKPFYT